MIHLLCPECRAHIGRNWQPFRVLDGLSISWQCPNGHSGQLNRVECIIPPIGRPPDDFPPLAPDSR